MVRLMASAVDETIANIEKKQARTYDELQAELEEAQEASPPRHSSDCRRF